MKNNFILLTLLTLQGTSSIRSAGYWDTEEGTYVKIAAVITLVGGAAWYINKYYFPETVDQALPDQAQIQPIDIPQNNPATPVIITPVDQLTQIEQTPAADVKDITVFEESTTEFNDTKPLQLPSQYLYSRIFVGQVVTAVIRKSIQVTIHPSHEKTLQGTFYNPQWQQEHPQLYALCQTLIQKYTTKINDGVSSINGISIQITNDAQVAEEFISKSQK